MEPAMPLSNRQTACIVGVIVFIGAIGFGMFAHTLHWKTDVVIAAALIGSAYGAIIGLSIAGQISLKD